MANNLTVTQHLQSGLLAAKSAASSASSGISGLENAAGAVAGQVSTAAGRVIDYGSGAMSQLDGAAKSLTSGVNGVLNTNVRDLGSKLGIGSMTTKAAAALGLGGAASKMSGALGSGVQSLTDNVSTGVADKLGGLLGDKVGNSANGETNIAKSNDYGITREAWELTTAAGLVIPFNVNPTSVDFQFQGRAGISSTSMGRIIDQFKANGNTGTMDFDLGFNMQTGSLFDANMAATEGHQALMKIMQAVNEDMYLSGGVFNFHTLRLNTVLFGYMELVGRLSPNLAFNENAAEPFKNEYTLTFWVVKSTPALTESDALLKSVSSNG